MKLTEAMRRAALPEATPVERSLANRIRHLQRVVGMSQLQPEVRAVCASRGMATSPYYVMIKVDLIDVGFLPPILRREIEAVEHRIDIKHPDDNPETIKVFRTYEGQIRSCLAAVEKAMQPGMVKSRRGRK